MPVSSQEHRRRGTGKRQWPELSYWTRTSKTSSISLALIRKDGPLSCSPVRRYQIRNKSTTTPSSLASWTKWNSLCKTTTPSYSSQADRRTDRRGLGSGQPIDVSRGPFARTAVAFISAIPPSLRDPWYRSSPLALPSCRPSLHARSPKCIRSATSHCTST